MINRVVLVGRLTKDPNYRQTPTGVSVASFTLAVNRTFTSNNGERQADFINCVVFNKQADNVSRYVHKGSLVGIEGRIQTRNYDNPQGQRVYVTEVVCDSVQFLEPKNANNGATQGNYSNNAFASQGQASIPNNDFSDFGNDFNSSNNDFSAPPVEDPFAAPADNGFSKGIDLSDDDLPF